MTIFPNNRRAVFAFVHDIAMAALSFVVSLYLRLGGEIVGYQPRLTAIYVLCFTLIAAGVFLLTGLYRGIWRYASLPDLFNIARAVSLTVLVFLPVMFVSDPARGAAALDPADRLVRAGRAVGRAAPRLPAVQGPRPRPRSRTRQAPERAGAADQRQGRGRHLYPRDDARPARGLPGGRRPRRHTLAGRPRDLPGSGSGHDRFARRGGRPAGPARQTPAEADHHRQKPVGRPGAPAARPRRRAGDPAGAPAEADRFSSATSTIPNVRSSRSRSRICWAARRRCSTATGWRG